MNLIGSKTEKNLLAAFSGETQASIKYSYFAEKARKDGFEEFAAIIDETAHNEKEHAEIWYKQLNNGISSTRENLIDAIDREHYEWSQMYSQYAATAREEGFDEIAALFEGVAKIEENHEKRFSCMLTLLSEDKIFQADEETLWICRNCGHIHKGKVPPYVCPVCSKPQAYFQIKKTVC